MKLGVFVNDYTLSVDTLERIKTDGLILVLNGVYHATIKKEGKPSPLLDKADNIYVLSDDLQARGIPESEIDPKAKVISMSDLVDVIFNDFEKIAWL